MSISPTAKAKKVVNIPTVNGLYLSLLVCFLIGFIRESILCGLKKQLAKTKDEAVGILPWQRERLFSVTGLSSGRISCMHKTKQIFSDVIMWVEHEPTCLIPWSSWPACSGLPGNQCALSSLTTFEHAVLLCLRCASKACGRGEPQGRPGGALHVWTMGHSLWWWMDWSWRWGHLPAVGIQVRVPTVGKKILISNTINSDNLIGTGTVA